MKPFDIEQNTFTRCLKFTFYTILHDHIHANISQTVVSSFNRNFATWLFSLLYTEPHVKQYFLTCGIISNRHFVFYTIRTLCRQRNLYILSLFLNWHKVTLTNKIVSTRVCRLRNNYHNFDVAITRFLYTCLH